MKPLPPTAFNAIKHGAYSNLGLLPGEDPKEFEQLLSQLADEFQPSGPLEADAVADIAKLLWRKSNLGIYVRVKHASKCFGPYLTNKDEPFFDLDRLMKQRFVDIMGAVCKVSLEELQEHAANQEKVAAALKDVMDKVTALAGKDLLAQSEKATQEEAEDIHLAIMGDLASREELTKELELMSRIDAMIDRSVKRLLQLKAMKPMVGLGPVPAPNSNRTTRRIENNAAGGES